MKGARARRELLDLGACAAGAGVLLAVWLPSLPASPDFLLSRASGDVVALAVCRLVRSPGAAAAGAWLALLLLAGSLVFPVVALWRGRRELFSAARPARKQRARILVFSVAALALAACARWGVSCAVDVIENAWFPPESLDLIEPVALFLAAAGFAALLWRAVGGLWSRVFSRKAEAWTLALLLAAGLCDATGRLYGAGKASVAEAAGLRASQPRGRVVFVLEQDGRKQVAESHELVLGIPGQTQYALQDLEAVERLAAARGVFRRAALRYLYGGYTLQMDADGLRRALALGDLDADELARSLLLDNLSVGPVTDGARAFFAQLSDRRRLRAGPGGAARLYAAADHLGLTQDAADWRRRAESGPEGFAPGLLNEAGGSAWSKGVIEGRLRAPAGEDVKIALYAPTAGDSPYSLGPGQLVASAVLARDGRFRFADLASGDYFLAVAVDSADERPPHLRIRGKWSGLRISARRPRAEANLVLSPQ